jgi:hypothetical protein
MRKRPPTSPVFAERVIQFRFYGLNYVTSYLRIYVALEKEENHVGYSGIIAELAILEIAILFIKILE